MKNFNFGKLSFIDLTHTLSPDIPQWDAGCGFKHEMLCDYADCTSETKFRVQSINMSAGIGTHMDAPLHCFANGNDIASIPLTELIAPCVLIDVSLKANTSYQVTVDDIYRFENQHGMIANHSFVIIYTGWDQYWHAPDKYRNDLQFPTITEDAALLLLQRKIAGLGIDTLSPDNAAGDFPVHHAILGAGKYIIENIANAAFLPAMGAYIIALPLKIQDGTESPIRLIALVQ